MTTKREFYEISIHLAGGEKIVFTTEQDMLDTSMQELIDSSQWNYKENDVIWTGEFDDRYIPAKRVVAVSYRDVQ